MIALALGLSSCAPVLSAPPQRSIMVFAAASLVDAFGELGTAFELITPGVTVRFNFAGSQILRTQLESGATADVFASANHTEMDNAVKGGLIADKVAQDFASNTLVVVMPPANPAVITRLADLAKPGLKIVLADASVPAGKYARQIIDAMGKDAAYGAVYRSAVLANVISNETDVRMVVTKVQLGEADAGIVYISDAVAAPTLKKLEIPAPFAATASYPIAPLAKSAEPQLAAAFIQYVLSAKGQATLAKWGFAPAGK